MLMKNKKKIVKIPGFKIFEKKKTNPEIRWTSPQHLMLIRFMVSENGDWTDATKSRGPIHYMITSGCSHREQPGLKKNKKKMSERMVQGKQQPKFERKPCIRFTDNCDTDEPMTNNFRFIELYSQAGVIKLANTIYRERRLYRGI